jgi:hypothetical protein
VNVSDVDSANFDTGSLTVSLTANATADDRLEILHEGFGANQIGLVGEFILFAGITIGKFSGGVGTTALVIDLFDKATPTAVKELARNITFRTLGTTPSTSPRTVQSLLNDGDGGTSAAVSKTINVVDL